MVAEMLVGIRLVRVAPLESDGSIPTSPQWHEIDTPQQANVSVVTRQGQEIEIRGGDRLLAVITEEDDITGMDVTFQDAAFDLQTLAVIDGGSLTGTAPDQEYEPRPIGTPHPRFCAEIYVARYAEGTSQASDIVGYTKIYFPNCTGVLSGLNLQNQTAAAPQFTIRARDHIKENLRFVRFSLVPALPTGPGSGS